MPRIPLPRRGLRNLFILCSLIIGPYLLFQRFQDGTDDELAYGDIGSSSSGSGAGVPRRSYGDEDDAGPYGERYMVGRAKPVRKQKINKAKGKVTRPPQGGTNNKLGLAAKNGTTKSNPAAGKGVGMARPRTRKDGLADHRWEADGLLYVDPKGRHPIYDLIERAKENWDTKLSKASKTLGEAVDEYRRRYGRPPPKGFDRWSVSEITC